MSNSFMGEFQSRRLNIRYRTAKGVVQYAHTLNNTVIAVPRAIRFFMENNQQVGVVGPKQLNLDNTIQDTCFRWPGFLTPLYRRTPLGRLGTVSDMADAVVFLCSDASRFITGAGLPVDGGMVM